MNLPHLTLTAAAGLSAEHPLWQEAIKQIAEAMSDQDVPKGANVVLYWGYLPSTCES